jgi:hypothetical protein
MTKQYDRMEVRKLLKKWESFWIEQINKYSFNHTIFEDWHDGFEVYVGNFIKERVKGNFFIIMREDRIYKTVEKSSFLGLRKYLKQVPTGEYSYRLNVLWKTDKLGGFERDIHTLDGYDLKFFLDNIDIVEKALKDEIIHSWNQPYLDKKLEDFEDRINNLKPIMGES